MAPVSQGLNDNVELLIVRGVPESNVIQLLAEELDRVAILAQDTPMLTLEASQETSNTLLKSGNRRTVA